MWGGALWWRVPSPDVVGLDMVEHSHGPVPGNAVETPMAKHIKALIRVRLKPCSLCKSMMLCSFWVVTPEVKLYYVIFMGKRLCTLLSFVSNLLIICHFMNEVDVFEYMVLP